MSQVNTADQFNFQKSSSNLLSAVPLRKVASMGQANTVDQCNFQKSSSKCFEIY